MGWPVATVALVGGGGSVRVRRTEVGERMRARESERGTGRVGEGRGEGVASVRWVGYGVAELVG